VINSTNWYAIALLEREKPAEGTVIVAGYQTEGKGQDTNSWESEANMNLTFSIILYPTFLPIEDQFQLNKIIALGVTDFISRFIERNVSIKWPNDVYVSDRKIAGILINNSIIGDSFLYSVAGIGININQMLFKSDAPNPVSLKMVTGRHYDLEECLNLLCADLDKRYEQLKEEEINSLDRDYLRILYGYGKFYSYLYHDQQVSAKITGVDEFGRLLVLTAEGQTLICNQKEITFIIS
jgi:BirA family biotin operon repressor/biotin-[acetyl-CoA-carboxylase] ligase